MKHAPRIPISLGQDILGVVYELTNHNLVPREESLALHGIDAAADTVVSTVFPAVVKHSPVSICVVHAAVIPVPSPGVVIPSGHALLGGIAVTKPDSQTICAWRFIRCYEKFKIAEGRMRDATHIL